jgi:hypothetical protein
MDKLEIHTLLCHKDISWLHKTISLFKYHSHLDFDLFIHEDGSLSDNDKLIISNMFENYVTIIDRNHADSVVADMLKPYPLCQNFRLASHHTIFKIKLFDIFFFTRSNNILYMDSDILCCNKPSFLLNCIQNKIGTYLKDHWTSYCVPFRDEDKDTIIERRINAGLNYYPTIEHFNVNYIEDCLDILYSHGSRYATHPFLEQTCIAYMITKLKQKKIFIELPEDKYCVPVFNKLRLNHNFDMLHLNSCPLVGKFKTEYYEYELSKLSLSVH